MPLLQCKSGKLGRVTYHFLGLRNLPICVAKSQRQYQDCPPLAFERGSPLGRGPSSLDLMAPAPEHGLDAVSRNFWVDPKISRAFILAQV